jgi:hypothetical protein
MRKLLRRWVELTAIERMLLRRAVAASIVARIALVVLPWKRLAERKPPAAHAARSTLPDSAAVVQSTLDVGTYLDERGAIAFHAAVTSGGMTICGERPMTVLASFANS